MAKLQMLPIDQYPAVNRDDPIRFYNYPIVGSLYRRRVELCLSELSGGDKILEVGFGSGVTFLSLKDGYKEIYGLELLARIDEISSAFRKLNVNLNLKIGSVLDMPYPDNYFDSVLLISILEHLRPETLDKAFFEIRRVLKTGGQVIYGVPVSNPIMELLFRLLGYDIKQHHFSTENQISCAAENVLKRANMNRMKIWGLRTYEVGHFVKI